MTTQLRAQLGLYFSAQAGAPFSPLNTWRPNFIITANTLIKLTPQLAIRECTIYIDRPAFLWLRPNNTSMDAQAIPPGSGRCSQQLENPIQLPRLSTPGVPAVVVTIPPGRGAREQARFAQRRLNYTRRVAADRATFGNSSNSSWSQRGNDIEFLHNGESIKRFNSVDNEEFEELAHGKERKMLE